MAQPALTPDLTAIAAASARSAPPDGARPRVMQVVLTLYPGGTERLVIEIARRLGARADMLVCCLDEPGTWAGELKSFGVPLVSLGRAPGFRPALAARLAGVARRAGARILHCHNYTPFVYGALASLWDRGLRVIFTEHGRAPTAPVRLKRRLANGLLGRVPATTCAVSEDLREHMIASGFPAARVGVVHNGIEPGSPVTDAERRASRQALGIPDDAFVAGTVARLEPVKALETLIDAAARLRARAPELCVLIAGDGRERGRLAERADRAGLGHVVRFLGVRSDIRRILSAMDVFVNTSTSEGISLTILEAMAASLPVVASRVGGTPEIVVEERTGLLVPPEDPAAVAAAVGALRAEPRWRRLLGENGRLRVERHFNFDTMVMRYDALYRELHAEVTPGSQASRRVAGRRA